MIKYRIKYIIKYIGLFLLALLLTRFYFRTVNNLIMCINYQAISDNVQLLIALIVYITIIFPAILILLKAISHSIVSEE